MSANYPGPCPPHLRLVNVSKRFGSLVVLDGLSLTIRERESVVILGPSGTGKSVLLKHLVGLLRPDAGEVFFRDTRIDNLRERRLEPIRERFGFLDTGGSFESVHRPSLLAPVVSAMVTLESAEFSP